MAEIKILKTGSRRRTVLLPHLLKSFEEYTMSFISKTIKHFIGGRKERKLAAEYKEASLEIKTTNQELEGALSDGLD
jgi:hypothetical protein